MNTDSTKERSFSSDLWDQATMCWYIGDWESLIELPMEEVKRHPASDALLVYIASAYFQTGNGDKSKELFSELPREAVLEHTNILLSSLYSTIGKAKAVMGDSASAEIFFSQAVKSGLPHVQSKQILRARKASQLEQVGIFTAKENLIKKQSTFRPHVVESVNLGQAWSSNTVNMVIFRHHAIFSSEGKQYTAFYADMDELKIVQRDLSTGEVRYHLLSGEYNLHDAHNSISLGIDRLGYIHISYDHHGSRLRYRRSNKPHDISTWTEELPMTGIKEEKVTYPTFILPKAGSPLLMLYRDGNWKKGEAHLKSYDEESSSWMDYPSPVLSGALQQPWTSNAYWNNPVMGKDGELHLSFTWRTDYVPGTQDVNNINIGYAKSFDHGYTWYTSNNRPCSLPITQVNGETAWPIPPGSNLINQCSMALDSRGYPHIVFYADDEKGIPQYRHIWFDGKQWRHSYASCRTEDFSLSGGGTLSIPISRPDIVIDKNDNVYIIHRGDDTQQKISATFMERPNYKANTKHTMVLYEHDVGFSEPIIDRSRWESEGVLSLLIQYAEQPDKDAGNDSKFSAINIVDVVIST